MSTHARLSPSDKSWPKCPGSPREQAKYEDIPGEAAIDGTGSHLLLEMCMKNSVRAEHYDMQIIGANHEDNRGGWLVDMDRCERVQECLDYISRRKAELDKQFPGCHGKIEAESKSDPGGMFGRDDWNGTCDVTITMTNDHGFCLYLETIDYKDGRGWVDVKNNSQLLSYLGGKLRKFIASGPDLVRPFNPERVGPCRMTIVQPKTNPSVRYEEMSAAEVMDAVTELSRAAAATDDPDAPLISDGNGKGHCRWCKHRDNCNAGSDASLIKVKEMSKEIAGNDGGLFDLIGSPVESIKALPDDKLTELFDAAPGIMQIFEHVKEELQTRVETTGVDGFEMKAGRGSNVYNMPEEEVIKKLKTRMGKDGKRLTLDDICPRKLITPAQIVKHKKLTPKQREKIGADLISFVAGKTKSLSRVAFNPKLKEAQELFAGVNEEVPVLTEAASFDDIPTTETEEVSFF